jgi:predicted ester cyclase
VSDDLIDAFQSALSGRVRHAFAGCCAVDVHYEDPLTDTALHGIDQLADHAAKLWTLFPDAQVQRSGERLFGGRFVAAPIQIVGTHTGELPRLPPTRRRIAVHGILYCELAPDADRLWRVRAFFDAYDAAVQLGVLPKHGTAGERALMLLRGFGLRGS